MLTFSFLFFFTSIFAQDKFEISGKILDAKGAESLIGAIISSENLKRGDVAALDGFYSFKNIPAGSTVDLHINYPGYGGIDTTVTVNQNLHLNFKLHTVKNLTEVVIAGRMDRESEGNAKKTEQNAINTINAISARTIELSPDITVANVMQRISGVTIERSSNGDGRYAIIRGMDQRYGYTLVNGIKIPSPDNKNRYVPLDIFPADMVERIDVNKTLTPDMEGDAIGGSVNMIMKNAPDKLYVKASLSTGYAQNLFNQPFSSFPVSAINMKSPYEQNGDAYLAQPEDFTRANLNFTKKTFTPNTFGNFAVGNRFFHKKLGVMLTGSYQNVYKQWNAVYNEVEAQTDGTLYIKNAYTRNYSTHITRSGVNLKTDYNINDNNKISLYALYCRLNEAQSRLSIDTLQVAPRTGYGNGQIWYYNRSMYQTQSIGNITLQGTHHLFDKHFEFTWSGVTSVATNRIPDWAEYEYDGGYYADQNGTPPYTHANVAQDFNRTWWHNTDRDYTGYAKLKYQGVVAKIPVNLSVGGMYRNKHRDNYYDNYLLRPIPNASGQKPSWTGINELNWAVFNPSGSPVTQNSYGADEDITAYYAMLQFQIHKLSVTAGVRNENTHQAWTNNADPTFPGRTGSIDYMDILPSLTFKYKLNDITNLRASYYAAVSRPTFSELLPYSMVMDNYTVYGNPYIQHTTSDNFDVRYELFPNSNEQILIGAFYKKLYNPIEMGFGIDDSAKGSTIMEAQNYGTATNYGFEVVYEKYYRSFGIRANYTYTHSTISSGKYQPLPAIINGKPDYVINYQKRPLQGQSANVANLALLYRSKEYGIDAQLTWQYTGKRIAVLQPFYDADYWQKAMSIFDFSAEKKIGKHFVVFTKVQNLLNSAYVVYMKAKPSNTTPISNGTDDNGHTLVSKEKYGQNYQLGIRFTL